MFGIGKKQPTQEATTHGDHSPITQIVNITLGENTPKETKDNVAKQLELFFTTNTTKTQKENDELKEEIKRLLKQLDGKTTIEEILAEERNKRIALQKELEEFRKSNPNMETITTQLEEALANFRYKEYHDTIDNYTKDEESAKLKYLSAKEYFDRLLYDNALKEIKKALSLDEEKTDTYIALYAYINYRMGDYNEALKYSQKSLAFREKTLGTKHSDTARKLQ
jgi:tetratricopeptide (TPR) repeat protein